MENYNNKNKPIYCGHLWFHGDCERLKGEMVNDIREHHAKPNEVILEMIKFHQLLLLAEAKNPSDHYL